MGEGKIDEAIAAFEAASASAGDSPADQARKYEAMLGHARGLIMQTKFDEALKIMESITEKRGPVEDTALEAEAYVVMGHALQGLGRNKEAILAYLYVDLIFPRESDSHAEALYQLVPLWKLRSTSGSQRRSGRKTGSDLSQQRMAKKTDRQRIEFCEWTAR